MALAIVVWCFFNSFSSCEGFEWLVINVYLDPPCTFVFGYLHFRCYFWVLSNIFGVVHFILVLLVSLSASIVSFVTLRLR